MAENEWPAARPRWAPSDRACRRTSRCCQRARCWPTHAWPSSTSASRL